MKSSDINEEVLEECARFWGIFTKHAMHDTTDDCVNEAIRLTLSSIKKNKAKLNPKSKHFVEAKNCTIRCAKEADRLVNEGKDPTGKIDSIIFKKAFLCVKNDKDGPGGGKIKVLGILCSEFGE